MQSKLLKAITTVESSTENGAITNSTTLSPIVDLFFLAGASRQLSEAQIISKLSLAYNTDKLLTTKLVFWAGDIREGLGERRFFKTCLKWIKETDADTFMKNIENVPYFNRYDSLLEYVTNLKVTEHIYEQLKAGNNLCGKWMPRKPKTDIQKQFIKTFCNLYKLTPKKYRKLIVSATNNSVVENKMCKKQWSDIAYKTVPSVAFKKYRKAFKRNDETRFSEFLDKAIKGEEKINAKAIFPHDIVAELMNEFQYPVDRRAIDAQWKNLPDLMAGNNENILPVCDTSGSMNTNISGRTTALQVCLALGIYVSERMNGLFKDSFITFSRNAKLQTLKGNVCDRIEQLNTGEVANTNLQRVFDLILTAGTTYNIPQEEMPSKLLILSDMEFDSACDNNSATNFETYKKKFENAGYIMPQIIFWNLASRSTSNYPVQIGTAGTALVSGFSPNIIKSILGGEIMPEKVVLRTLNNKRYDRITV